MNSSEIQSTIAGLIDPFTGRSLAQDKVSIDIQTHEGRCDITLTLGYPCAGQVDAWQAKVSDHMRERGFSPSDFNEIKVSLRHRVVAHQVQGGVQTIPGVKNVIAVGSGKGGVGKSTVSANLALALAAQGARVGLLDADIYGPSVPTVMGVNRKPEVVNGQFMKPLDAHGLQLMSVGFMVPPESALVWRGPMAVQALEQLFRQTAWDDLDYLIVDLPPGTGDIQLSLAQKMPVTGAVIVTTPQDLALADARKAVAMFEKVSVPVLGVVENMAMYCCPNCGHQEAIFGTGGGASMAASMGLDNLGGLPLHARIRADADAGCPTVAAAPESELSALYTEVALKVAAKVAMRAKDYSQKFPSIRVSTDT